MDWYYSLDGLPTGPVNDDQFNDLVLKGVITPQTHVWHAGMTDWQFYQPAPPAVPTAVSNPEETIPDSTFKAVSFNVSDLERAVAKAAAAAKAEEDLAARPKKKSPSTVSSVIKNPPAPRAEAKAQESPTLHSPPGLDSSLSEIEKAQAKDSAAARQLGFSRPPKITLWDLINLQIKKIRKEKEVPEKTPVVFEKKTEAFPMRVENTGPSAITPVESPVSAAEPEKEKTIPFFQPSGSSDPIESKGLLAPAVDAAPDSAAGLEEEGTTPSVPPSDLTTLVENHELVSAGPDEPFDSSVAPKEEPLFSSSKAVEESGLLEPVSEEFPNPPSHWEKEQTTLSLLSNSLSELIQRQEPLEIMPPKPVDPVFAPKEERPIFSSQPLPSSLPVESDGLFDPPSDSSLDLSVIPIGKPFMSLPATAESKTSTAVPEESSDSSDSLLLAPVLSEDWKSFSDGPAGAPDWAPLPQAEPLPEAAPLPYARVGLRSAAKVIDLFVYAGLFGVILVPLTDGFFTSRTVEPGQVLLRLAAGFVFVLGVHLNYQTFFLTKYGDTPGKMILGLKVVRSDGDRLTFLHAFFRAWGEVLSWMTLGVGYLLAVSDVEKRALHDRLCATRVIQTARPEKMDGAKNNQASNPTASD